MKAIVPVVLAACAVSGKSVGSDIGDVIRDNNSGSMQQAWSEQPQDAVTNPAVEGVVNSANAKASFLTKGLNLHLQETPAASGSIVSTELRHDRHQLAALAADEARFQQMFANSMQKSFLNVPSDAQREGASIQNVKSQIGGLSDAVAAGGYTAFGAMSTLLSLTSDPNARTAMNLNITLLRNLKNLMSRESTSDQARVLAGSIITRVTNIPVASESSDDKSGSYGHVNIVMPSPSRVYGADAERAQLNDGARPRDTAAGDYYSFLLPAGVSSGLHAAAVGGDEWQLNLHPPEEDSKMVSDAIDSTLKIEEAVEKAREGDFLAEKQRLLNAELAKVHQIAGRSFLKGSLRRSADYSVVLNAPEESATEVRSAIKALRTVEANKERAAMADYVADKQRLLAAEIAKIHRVAGH